MKYSEDYIYVKNHDVLSVWNKYRPLAMIYWKKISVYIRHDLYDNGFDEWMQDVYIVYDNAMNGVKLDKIKNPESYCLHIQLSQYLHNFTTRNIIRDYTHRYAIRYMDYNESPEGESEFEWDSILATEDSHSNTWSLVDTLPEKYKEKAVKTAWHLPRGGANSNKWPEEVRKLFMDFYTKY